MNNAKNYLLITAVLGFAIGMTPWVNTNSAFSAESNLALSTENEKANASIIPLPGVPEDFELVYGFGATHAERGRTRYAITADGAVVVEKSRFVRSSNHPIVTADHSVAAAKEQDIRNSGPQQEFQQYQLTAGELAALWKNIQTTKFFGLKENYTNPHIMDGSSSFIYVKANGKEHTVSVMNTKVKAFDRIVSDIEKLFDKKVAK